MEEEDLLIDVSNHCFVCDKFMETSLDLISITYRLKTGEEATISAIIEKLMNVSLSEQTILGAFICKDCFTKFNEWNNLIAKCKQIQDELIYLYNDSRNSQQVFSHVTKWDECESEIVISCSMEDSSVVGLQTQPKKSHKSFKEFSCKICGKVMPSAAKLRDHLTVHSKSRHFICPHDGLSFKTKDNLNQHLKTHSHAKYECDHCGQLMKSKTTLSRHMNRHNKSKMFECPKCRKVLINKEWFVTHLAQHENIRKFNCNHPKCGKSFFSNHYLNKHKRTHQPARYMCTVCEKFFTQKYNLKIHLDTIHNGISRKRKVLFQQKVEDIGESSLQITDSIYQ